jgi:hypothetical protein
MTYLIDTIGVHLITWDGPQPRLLIYWHRFREDGRPMGVGYTTSQRFNLDDLAPNLQGRWRSVTQRLEAQIRSYESGAWDDRGIGDISLKSARVLVDQTTFTAWHNRWDAAHPTVSFRAEYRRIDKDGQELPGYWDGAMGLSKLKDSWRITERGAENQGDAENPPGRPDETLGRQLFHLTAAVFKVANATVELLEGVKAIGDLDEGPAFHAGAIAQPMNLQTASTEELQGARAVLLEESSRITQSLEEEVSIAARAMLRGPVRPGAREIDMSGILYGQAKDRAIVRAIQMLDIQLQARRAHEERSRRRRR